MARRLRLSILHLLHVCLLIGILCPSSAYSTDVPVLVVLYPDIPEPYRGVFTSIIDGIKQHPNATIKPYALGKNPDLQALNGWLRSQQASGIIALGQRGMDTALALRTTTPIVVGAVLLTTELSASNLSGISLATDPGKLFSELLILAPHVKRVHVVYEPKRNAALVEQARIAAKAQGLELRTYESTDTASAAQAYLDMFKLGKSNVDALWLPPDDSAEDSAIQAEILRQAWDLRLPVFSTNPVHVKRGVLFALYPDTIALGRSLAAKATWRTLGTENTNHIGLLTDVLLAANLRTADHLDLTINSSTRRRFTLVFP